MSVTDDKHKLEIRLILDANGNGGRRLRKEILVDGVRRTGKRRLGNSTR